MQLEIDNKERCADFVRLNEIWITEHFRLEESDRKLAEDPYAIVRNGGHIFSLLESGKVVGVCALFRESAVRFQLARIAVDPAERGKGYGDVLLQAALAKAREAGAQTVYLLSNTILEPAIALYRKYGFRPVTEGAHPVYARCNIVMELNFMEPPSLRWMTPTSCAPELGRQPMTSRRIHDFHITLSRPDLVTGFGNVCARSPFMNHRLHRIAPPFLVLACGLALALPAAAADRLPTDVPGSADPALLKRFTGSTLIGYKVDSWDAVRIPTSAAIDTSVQDKPFRDLVTIEGKRTRAVYLAPLDKSPLEVYRNYEQALKAAGFKKKFACEADCFDVYRALDLRLGVTKGLAWSKGDIPSIRNASYNPYDAVSHEEGRLLVGTLPQGGVDNWVLVYVSKAVNNATRYSQAFVQVVQPKAMQTGQVTVLKASDIQSGLRSDGKVAFYGVYFDTGKAEVKPNSKAQLDEIAKLLKAQPTLQVFVVGHTDGQGAFEANLQLSQQRAQAVVNALVQQQGIDARRLTARGVASLAPLAGNGTEEGRARNRRVELVLR